MTMVAALFVATGGCYFGLAGVEPWDKWRDARDYAGPWPVVAHPPCERWGRYWNGGPSARVRRVKGADEGCFVSALASVQRWGGVIEHPEGSHAWRAFNIVAPPRSGGWVPAGIFHPGAWTCCVEQGHYGHRARKATWLYAYGVGLPALKWGSCGTRERLDEGFHSAEERRRAVRTGVCQRLSKTQRAATPHEFRDVLLRIATGLREAPSDMEESTGKVDTPPTRSASALHVLGRVGSARADTGGREDVLRVHGHDHEPESGPCKAGENAP